MSSLSPEALEHAFDQVQGHLLELHARWGLFRKLYRGNADSVPVLTEVGGEVFWVLGRLLHRGSLLLFRQLTDGPTSRGKRNASYEGLLHALGGPSYKIDHADLMDILAQLRSKQTIKDHVNKYIAHLDLDLLSGAAAPPKGVEILDFEDALRLMREITSLMRERFAATRPLLEFEEGAAIMVDQAQNLVDTLRKGLNA